MGCGASSPELQAQAAQNKRIQQQLSEAKKKFDNDVKLLLLGAGESGKSTFSKQMKILHLSGFSDKERVIYKQVIFDNIISNSLGLILGCESLGIEIGCRDSADEVLKYDTYEPEDLYQLKDHVVALWADSGVQEAYERRSEFQLGDNCKYFADRLEEIISQEFVPSEADILHSRSKTTGILETEFKVGRINFRMVDVGGQRSERKKWMHCFQDVTAVIFCVSLSAYDQCLDEDDTTNRMQESLGLWNQIVNSAWFKDTNMILFLNKSDLFREKIQRVNITPAFPKYRGEQEFEAASTYIQEQFLARVENSSKQVFTHITCATDTSNIAVVFTAVKSIIMEQNFVVTGLE